MDTFSSAFRVDGRDVDRRTFDRAALDPARSVVIQACAGSGKTWVLVARLLRLLLAGAQPSEILAITFTRKAAQEMRERLLKLLEELALGSDTEALDLLVARGLDPAEARTALPRARGLFEDVLRASAPMTIETFHGWFGRIVRSAPLVAGVPAGFGMADQTSALRDAARRDVLSLLGRDEFLFAAYGELLRRVGQHNAWALIDALLRRRNEWQAFLRGRPMATVLVELGATMGVTYRLPESGREPDPRWGVGEDPRTLFLQDATTLTSLRQLAAIFADGTAAEQSRARRALTWLEGPPDALGPEAFEDLNRLVASPNGGAAKPTRQSREAACLRWGPAGDRDLERECESLASAFAQARDRAREADGLVLNGLVWICAEAMRRALDGQKRARGVLDFEDLEWLAYALLQDDASAAYVQTRLDARYRHILVDEFQDTNPLQWITLKSWLTGYGSDLGRPSVLLVGDPNQSIYRFRGAEARLFDEARVFLSERYGASDLRSNETRRCAPVIVDFLNATFLQPDAPNFSTHQTLSRVSGLVSRLAAVGAVSERGIDPDTADTDRALLDPSDPSHAADALDAFDASCTRDAEWELRDAMLDARVEEESARRLEEARRVSQAIEEIVGVRMLEQVESVTGAGRLAGFRDVLVLVRQRANMAYLERAFRAVGIPYTSDRSGGLLATLEALDLCALLRFLVVPFSDHLLAHVLRTPIFSVSDADLIRLADARALGETWWQRLRSLPSSDPLARVARVLASWTELAGVRPVHDLLDRIYHEGAVIERYVTAIAGQARGILTEQVRQNLLAYMELALTLDSGRYPSLSRFIEELDALAQGSPLESPDEPDTDFGDTVRILTIHGAKGLESPIVFLTDTAVSTRRSHSYQTLVDWRPSESHPRRVWVFGSKENRSASQSALLEQESQLDANEDRNLLYVAATRAKEVLVLSGVEPSRGNSGTSWYARCAPYARLIETQGASLPVDAGGGDSGRGGFPPPSGQGEDERPQMVWIADFRPVPFPTGQRAGVPELADEWSDTARRRGIALHRVLEAAAGALPDPDRARAIARSEGLTASLGEEVARLAMRILSEPALRRFFDPGLYRRAFSEIELITPEGALLRMDRLVEFDNEVWVLDYKSSASSAGLAPHRSQLEIYRAALEARKYGRPVRAGIIFADAVLIEL